MALVLVLAMPVVLELSASFLVEVPAATLAVLALAPLNRLAGAGKTSTRRWPLFLAAVALVGATILMKYNIGLPLIAAAVGLAVWSWWRGDKRSALWLLAIAVVGVGVLGGFLSLQQDGWQEFRSFARNRANTSDSSAFGRLVRYGALYAGTYSVHWLVAVVVGALAIVAAAVRHRSALTIAALVYVATTLATLALHPYVLSRNIFAAAVILVIPASIGAVSVVDGLRDRPRAWRTFACPAGLGLVLILLGASTIQARREVAATYNGRDSGLADLSEFVAEELAAPGSCRIVGTFNQFSPGWVRLLSAREGYVASPLRVEFPYPLERGRDRLDPRADPRYSALVADWIADREERVILISVAPGSRWWSEDYARFGCWKQRLIDALAAREELGVLRTFDHPDAGLSAQVLVDADRTVVFGRGWGRAEHWGRWALDDQARVYLRGVDGPSDLILRFAAGDDSPPPLNARVKANGQLIGTLAATAAAWRWQTAELSLPATDDSGLIEVVVTFDECRPIGGRMRAMAFAEIAVRSRDASIGTGR